MELLAGATFGLLSVGLHTRGESERIDQEQLGEVSHLRGLLLREYLVFLVGGLVSVQAYDVCPFPHRGRHEMPLSEHVYTSQQVVREGHFGAGDSCGCSLKNLPKHHSGARPVSAAQAVLSFVKVPRDALWKVIRGLKILNLRVDGKKLVAAPSRVAEQLGRIENFGTTMGALHLNHDALIAESAYPERVPYFGVLLFWIRRTGIRVDLHLADELRRNLLRGAVRTFF